MTSVLEFGVHMFTRCSIRFKITHFPAYLGGWAPGGVCIFLEMDPVFEFDFWKTTRRDRVRVFAKFEIPRRVRGLSWNQKKKARRGRGLSLDPRLDPSIPHFSNSLVRKCLCYLRSQHSTCPSSQPANTRCDLEQTTRSQLLSSVRNTPVQGFSARVQCVTYLSRAKQTDVMMAEEEERR